MDKKRRVETIDATKTTFQILEVLTDSVEPLGVTALARRVDAHKSTAYKHLYTLRQLGYVEKTDSKYTPSVQFLDFGHHVADSEKMLQPVKAHLDELANTTGETTGFVIERNGIAVDAYVTQNESADDKPTYNRRYLHCSAAGKALLAEQPMDAVRSHLDDQELLAVTSHTLTDRQIVLDEISRVCDYGFAFDRQEQYVGVNSVATSVTHPEWTAAVYVSGSTDELAGKRFKDIIPGALQSTARKIESDLY